MLATTQHGQRELEVVMRHHGGGERERKLVGKFSGSGALQILGRYLDLVSRLMTRTAGQAVLMLEEGGGIRGG